MPTNRISELISEIDEALTVEDLMQVGCNCSECERDHILMLYPSCHPEGRIVASFDRRSGCLVLGCAECHAPYGSFQLAHRVVD
jgi:hypothetical protein